MKLTTYEIVLYCLAGAGILFLLYVHPWEHMTNADIQKKQEFHAGKPTAWKMPNAEDTKTALQPQSTQKKSVNTQIMGPTIPESEANAPKPTLAPTGKNGSGVYPHIYGPELLIAPGTKDSEHSQPKIEDDFIPAAEFPAGPEEPQPYLNDFSRMLKM